MNAPKPAADATLDALAAELAPRIVKLLREQSGADDALAELLAGSGFEIDNEAQPIERVKLAPAPRRRSA